MDMIRVFSSVPICNTHVHEGAEASRGRDRALALADAYQRAILGIAEEGDGEVFARQVDAVV
jgi:hypothetical protein